jgi:hypothetical protein
VRFVCCERPKSSGSASASGAGAGAGTGTGMGIGIGSLKEAKTFWCVQFEIEEEVNGGLIERDESLEEGFEEIGGSDEDVD